MKTLKRIGLVVFMVVGLAIIAVVTGWMTGCIDPDEALPHYGIHKAETPQ